MESRSEPDRSKAMPSLSLRIGITGSAGTGKTALSSALAERLSLPLIGEEVRAHLESNKQSVAGWKVMSQEDRRHLLESLWSKRRGLERRLGSFVADNCALDFTVYALAHGIYDDRDSVTDSLLLLEPGRLVGSYDAVFVLPHGGLPYVSDGVRAEHAVHELRNQYLIESALQRHVAPGRVHFVPREMHRLGDRIEFVEQRLASSRVSSSVPARVPKTHQGVVYLVGAGPGHPELLTVRAQEVLRTADVVAHDRLISAEMLSAVAPQAEWMAVGHRGRGARHVSYRLHPAALDAARAGKTVVRLKAGDPLIFGRGGEEAEELSEEGIPFEIIPGVSAAVGAAAYAGIPLTHREHASDVTFATGHEAGSGRPTLTDWQALAQSKGTTVLYMAARRLEESLARLVELGRDPATPAAYIAAATQVDQRVLIGTLGTMAEIAQAEDRSAPGLVMIGEVVSARNKVDWLPHRRPLFHKRVLVARARPGRSKITAGLESKGARVVELPQVCDEALEGIATAWKVLESQPCDGWIFGGASEVRYLLANRNHLPQQARVALEQGKTLTLHSSAAEALEEFGYVPGWHGNGSCLDALTQGCFELWGEGAGQALWIPVSQEGRPVLVRDLSGLGYAPQALRTMTRRRLFPDHAPGKFDLAVYPSSSAARSVLEHLGVDRLRDTPSVSIGPTTTRVLQEFGLRWIHESSSDSVDAVLDEAHRLLTVDKARGVRG